MKTLTLVFFLAGLIFLSFDSAQAENSPSIIRVGIFQNKPVVFHDEEGVPQGLYIDLLNEIAKQKNWQLEFVFDSWANSLERLEKNDTDLMTSIAYTKERDVLFDFSQENVLTMWGQVYTGKNSTIQSILDLDGQTVAILRNGINGINFIKLCSAFNIRCKIVARDTYKETVKLVEMGRADACVINNVHGYKLENDHEIRKTPIVFNPFKLLFAVPEGKHGDLLIALDEQLKAWKGDVDSFYFTKLYQWYGDKISSKKVIPKWLMYSLIISSGLVLLFIIWIKMLQYQMKERQKAEQALRKSEEMFRSVYHAAPLAFVVWDVDANVTDWNKKAEEVFGWSKNEVLGNNIFDFLIPENDIIKVEDVRDSHKKGDFLSHSINDNLTKEGKIITCEWNNSSLHDENGKQIGVTSLGFDITDRNLMEKEREELILKLQEAIIKIKTLKGMLPICSKCKKIRDDKGYWNRIEAYIEKHSDASFSHGMCPGCSEELYGDQDWYIEMMNKKETE